VCSSDLERINKGVSRGNEVRLFRGEFYMFGLKGKNFSERRIFRAALSLALAFAISAGLAGVVSAQAINEGFEDVTTLVPGGWFIQNNSSPPGTIDWFQGNPDVFTAQSGATDSYVGANYHATGDIGTISDWLLMPNRTLSNGDVLRFWTRTVKGDPFPDRLQVRLSLNGASTNVGSTATSVGDFTTLLLDIDPNYEGTYPDVFTEYTITLSGLTGPTSGRIAFRYFVENGGTNGANSDYIGIDTVSYTPAGSGGGTTQHYLDFNGDGRTDFDIVRNTGGGTNGQVTWYQGFNIGGQPSGGSAQQFGLATDIFVPADYDGDHITDIAAWRPGDLAYYYIIDSSTMTFRPVQFGTTGDDPSVVGDYTGDGSADLAVYREGAGTSPSVWYYLATSGPLAGQIVATQFGQGGDIPAPGDYTGDGKHDFVVQRAAGNGYGVFYIHRGTGGADVQVPGEDQAVQFGAPTDVIVPGDYDGDGKTDIATVRGGDGQILWNIRPSSTGVGNGFSASYVWGLTSDFITQGDYDGDGKTDVAVWRPSQNAGETYYYIISSATGSPMAPVQWGQDQDYPTANYNTH